MPSMLYCIRFCKIRASFNRDETVTFSRRINTRFLPTTDGPWVLNGCPSSATSLSSAGAGKGGGTVENASPPPRSSRRNFVAQMMTSSRNAVETSINFYVAVLAVIMIVLKWFQTPKYISTFAKWPPCSLLAAASWPANTEIQWDN